MKIAIIGIGNIGRRWLESIILSDTHKEIFCVEINQEIISSLKNEYGNDINIVNSINLLPKSLDFCAITTTSNIRRYAFDELIQNCNIRYIIFEKVLFQKEEDYYHVLKELGSHNIKAWVNCTRREFKSYISLKSKLEKCDSFTISIGGSNWGLGCNGIHLIDLIKYLSDSDSLFLNSKGLTLPIEESKRSGFKEFHGTLIGNSGKCKAFQISDFFSTEFIPSIISINSAQGNYVVDEANRLIHYVDKTSDWKWVTSEFPLEYTSQIMGPIVEKIINDGFSLLPTYEESMALHLLFIRGINDFLKNNTSWEEESCPIT